MSVRACRPGSGAICSKLEYVYTDYNGYRKSSTGPDKASLDFSRHPGRRRIGFRF